MNITLNGEPREILAQTVEAALAELGFADATVATALNGNFVPAALRQNTTLSEGDRLEVVAPMQGG
ncbi:MAG: sulfur carrier protein ThiS [Chromatiales bacterium]|jgi:sulfur carrier protein|nr:sulfur carrier protein ThiS [Chromatiales bacterium]